jgi:hypothetical protein
LHGKTDEQRRGLAAAESDEEGAVAVDPVVCSEGAAVSLHHVDVVDAPFRREAERVIDAVVDEGFPEGDDDRFGVRLGPFDQRSRSADGRRNSEADVRVAGRIDCCGGSGRSPASSRRKRWYR